MRRCLLLQGTLLMVFSIAAAQDDALTIEAFLKTSSTSYAIQFSTTYPNMSDTTNIVKYHVIKTVEDDPAKQTEAYTSNPPQPIEGKWKVTFDDSVDLAALSTKTVHLVLNGLNVDDVPIIKGDLSIAPFPEVASGFSGQLTAIESPPPKQRALTGNILRLTATNLGDVSEISPLPEGTEVASGDVHYYLGAGNELSYSLCVVQEDTIEVCDEPATMNETPLANTLTLDTAKLSYADPPNSVTAKLVLGVTSGASSPSTKLEVILNKDSSPSLLSADVLPSAEFDLDSYTIGTGMTLDIIGLDQDIMIEYMEHPIIDYEVYGTAIGSTSLEARWNFQELENYYISRDGTGSGFNEASVSCNPDPNSNNKVCFGYFPGLATNAYYRVTVDVGDGTTKTNSIESAPIPVGTPPVTGLQLQHRLDWHRNGIEAQIRVCFNHSSQNVEKDFSHYELVIINNDNGKWFKHRLMTQDTAGDLCFSPQTISKNDFYTSKRATIIVIQRATDGVTVLSSGETQLTL